MNMALLTDLLTANPSFQSLSLEQKEVFARLADEFQDNALALYLSPDELTSKLGLGNPHLWQNFLQLESVQAYIRQQVAFNAQVASRKALQALTNEAQLGDTTAAKQINELAGIFNKVDNTKIVVLHQIKRPKEASTL
jgi:hypothetical protein